MLKVTGKFITVSNLDTFAIPFVVKNHLFANIVTIYNYYKHRLGYASRRVPQKSLEQWMTECKFSKNEIDIVLNATKKFDVDLSINNKIAYWITYCFGGHSEYVYGGKTFGLRQMFFCNTQRFNDISYTRYWQNNDIKGVQKKKDLKDIIKLAWGTDFGVEKNQ